MKDEKKLARLTIDLSPKLHKELKVEAVMRDKSMREVVIEAIEEIVQRSDSKHIER